MPLLEVDQSAPDDIYRNLAAGCQVPWLEKDSLQRGVEELYECACKLLDRDFKQKAKVEFPARYSEMYFAAVAKDRLQLGPLHKSDEGPDLFLDQLNCWAEIVTATNGDQRKSSSLIAPECGVSKPYPENKIILRLTSVFKDKSLKLKRDQSKNKLEILDDQPIIVCINGGWLTEPIMYGVDAFHPMIKALFPVGDREYWVSQGGRISASKVHYRGSVKKESLLNYSDVDVPTQFFLDEVHAHISAVVFFNANAARPITRKKWGCDFVTIHNPLAKTPLKHGSIKCGVEYFTEVTGGNFTIHLPVVHELAE